MPIVYVLCYAFAHGIICGFTVNDGGRLFVCYFIAVNLNEQLWKATLLSTALLYFLLEYMFAADAKGSLEGCRDVNTFGRCVV